MNLIVSKSICNGSVTPPSSNSISHRVLICSALAMYQSNSKTKDIKLSKINGLVLSNDIFETLEVLNNKFCKFYSESDDIKYKDRINFNVYKYPLDKDIKEVKVSIKQSVSTLKLIIPIYLALGLNFEIEVNKSLFEGNFDLIKDLFKQMDCELSYNDQTNKLFGDGILKSGDYVIDSSISSQTISGLLMALPLLNGRSTLTIKKFDLIDKLLLTIEIMKKYGVNISYNILESGDYEFIIDGSQVYQLTDYNNFDNHNNNNYNNNDYTNNNYNNKNIENDYLAALNFVVLGLINNGMIIKDMNYESLQSECKFAMLLEEMGLLKFDKGNIIVNKDNELKYKEFDLTNYPELAPIVVVYLTQTGGVIHNVSKLLFKESNLLLTITQELGKAMVMYRYEKNKLYIEKMDKVKTDVVFDSHNEPLIAIALTIFSSINNGKAIICDSDCINRFYPNFLIDFYECNGRFSSF